MKNIAATIKLTIKDGVIRKNLICLSMPIACSTVIGIVTDLITTIILGEQNHQNYYFLALYLPISYILIAIMESFRACTIFISASQKKQHKANSIENKIILILIYGMIPIAVLFFGFKHAFPLLNYYLKIKDNVEIFQNFTLLMIFLSYVRYTSYILMGVLYGFSKIKVLFTLTVCYSIVCILLTYFFSKIITPSIYTLIYSLTISSTLLSVCVLIYLIKNRYLKLPCFKVLAKNFWPFLVFNLKFSLPIFLSYVVIFSSLFAYNSILANFGTTMVTGFGIAYRIQTLLILPAISLGITAGIIINQNKHLQTIAPDQVMRVALFTSLLLYAVIAIIVFVFRKQIILLAIPTTAIAQFAVDYLYYVAPSYIGLGPLLVLLTTLEQTGSAAKALLFNAVYFIAACSIGGTLSISYHHINIFYQTISFINLISLFFIAYYFFREKPFLATAVNFNLKPMEKVI